jgi:hypothetical protein
MRARPHPFFLVAIALLALAGVIALSVPAREPAVALRSVLVFRLEVALILIGAGYFMSSVL